MDNNYCCVPQCKSLGSDVPRPSFHRFPTEKNESSKRRREEWIRILKIRKQVTSRMVVCGKHFKPFDFFPLKDGELRRTNLKKNAVPSKNIPLTLCEKKEIKQKQEKSLVIRLERINSKERVSDTAKQTKDVERGKKLKTTVASNKKVNDVANSNTAHQQSSDSSRKLGLENSSDKNKVSGSSNLEIEVTMKEEPSWEAEYGVSEVASKHTTENSALESLCISSVSSVANENYAEILSAEEENSNNTFEETFDNNFYTKPFSMDEREKAFGNFIACELSDLHENLELYTRTKQCIIKTLIEAHFEQMSCSKKNNFSNIQSNNVVS